MAKPYSSGHIGDVAGTFTDMRISGQVKNDLVQLMVAELDRLVPKYEADTLANNSRPRPVTFELQSYPWIDDSPNQGY